MAFSENSFDLEWVPLRIFFVWHPSFDAGPGLAAKVHDWFGGPNRVWHRSGLAIPIMFWTSDDQDSPPDPVPTETQAFTVVVPLVDENFAATRSWRDWVNNCDRNCCHIRYWAIHPAAFKIDRLSEINPLGESTCSADHLQRLLMETCALLLAKKRREAPESPLSFFVSYARKDGTEIANQVRSALVEYGNVQVFMDVHDIEPGSGWKDRLRMGMEQGAAMLSIVTDEYSERAWCRKELREFRTPVKDVQKKNLWWLRPVFVLDALSGKRTRSMFEIGSAPTTRWHKGAASMIIDSLVRDVLFGEVQRLRAAEIESDDGEIINWVPDTWTLLELQRLLRPAKLEEVIYPGDGLPALERERLVDIFQGLKLKSFEEPND